jgi:anti-anti-sigma regulatory factor
MLDGDFDSSNAAQFKQALDHALHAGRPQLIVDLRGGQFSGLDDAGGAHSRPG